MFDVYNKRMIVFSLAEARDATSNGPSDLQEWKLLAVKEEQGIIKRIYSMEEAHRFYTEGI